MEKVIEHVNYDYDDRNRGDGAEKWRWLLRYETHSHVEQNYYYGSRLNVVRRKVFLPKLCSDDYRKELLVQQTRPNIQLTKTFVLNNPKSIHELSEWTSERPGSVAAPNGMVFVSWIVVFATESVGEN